MSSRSLRSALGRTVAALRKDGRLGPEDAALVRLAEQLADRLDAELADPDTPVYALSGLARTYFSVEEALRGSPAAAGARDGDPFQAFMESLSKPSPAALDGP